MFKDGYLYRLCSPAQWEGLRKCEHVPYSPDDAHDGYFHMSKPSQVLGTAGRHYMMHSRLYAIGCPEDAPGDLLKWEEARGELYPHVYGDVLTEWFDHIIPLIRHEDGFVPTDGIDHI